MFTDTTTTIYIVDTNSLAHIVGWKAYETNLLNCDDTLEKFINYQLVYLMSGTFFNNPKIREARFLFINDRKPYWRSEPLAELGVKYKFRKASNYQYHNYLPLIHTHIESFLAKQQVYVYMLDDYEADDLAALALFALHKEPIPLFDPYPNFTKNLEVNLLTTDYDWLPLTHYPDTYWLGLRKMSPRKFNSQSSLDFIRKHKYFNSTKAQQQFTQNMDSVLDLWRWKARFGDTSDSIPADKDGTDKYLPYINLINPPVEFDLKRSHHRILEIQKYISKPFSSSDTPAFGFAKFSEQFDSDIWAN